MLTFVFMVGTEVARKIDEEIKRREKILSEMQKTIQKRVVELKLFPGETVSRIQQINGVLVEFEKEV